ncbi:MAG: condensation domain-containing protein, partial [Acidimicrobiia bacterium]|nr:condensation domain-containing protein [Acidimicrobiia bacterium]
TLSAERFVTLTGVADPTEALGDDPARWYRTGDRARVVRTGVAVYGGRMDDQIKVDGMRLEPGEVEAALVTFPAITSALVRLWQPSEQAPRSALSRCVRCGLGTDVPGVEIDEELVCNGCRAFDMVAPQTERWFRDESDLNERRIEARRRRRGDIDCLHLLSGGKDSTYALYQLVERGWNVHALTLDNGFVSDGAKENIRRSVADLGITHEFASTPSMNEIFRDSLDRHSNVCQGCYKTIYTLAVARAHDMGIPVIVTGLSRGQFFETRLVPHQFEAGRFDPEAIDETVLEARRVYHRTTDAVTELLPEQRVFDDDRILEEIEFVDFYRYVDVELSELYRFLEERAPWVRPSDTGRSTNCLINVAGIQVHRTERGYHNYAEPYSWDVRLGHKTREEALEELDDEIDEAEVLRLLAEVGYEPKDRGVLTAWYQSIDGSPVDPDAVRRHLRDRLPGHAIPIAFVRVDEIPLAASAKADPSLLPAPTRFDRSGGDRVEPSTTTESRLCEIWATVLELEAVGVTEDFFDLGGASLDALEVVAAIDTQFGTDLPDAAVFRSPTVRALAEVVERALDGAAANARPATIASLDASEPLPLSAGEEAMLLEYRMDPDDPRYNVNRVYRIALESDDEFDVTAFTAAVGDVVTAHGPLHTSYGPDRRRLPVGEALSSIELASMSPAEFDRFADRQRSVGFDLDAGPLVRAHISRTGPGEVSILLGLHHISVDAGTFDLLWDQIVERYDTGALPELLTSYVEHGAWQRIQSADAAGFWRERARSRRPADGLGLAAPSPREADGYISRRCSATADVLTRPGSTPFASAMAATAVVLSRYSADARVGFGITASTKDHRDAAPLIGYYLNTLPVDLEVRPSTRFGDLVTDAASFVAEALPHRTYPFASMVRDARSAGHAAPAVSCMLAYEELTTPRFPAGVAEQRILASGSSVADVTFFVQERATSLQLGLEY